MSESVRILSQCSSRNLTTASLVGSSGDRVANVLCRYNPFAFRRAPPRRLQTRWAAFRSTDRCQSSAQWRNAGTRLAIIRSLRYYIYQVEITHPGSHQVFRNRCSIASHRPSIPRPSWQIRPASIGKAEILFPHPALEQRTEIP